MMEEKRVSRTCWYCRISRLVIQKKWRSTRRRVSLLLPGSGGNVLQWVTYNTLLSSPHGPLRGLNALHLVTDMHIFGGEKLLRQKKKNYERAMNFVISTLDGPLHSVTEVSSRRPYSSRWTWKTRDWSRVGKFQPLGGIIKSYTSRSSKVKKNAVNFFLCSSRNSKVVHETETLMKSACVWSMYNNHISINNPS